MLGSGEVKIRMYNVGTSACLNGQFYCQNLGDEPRVLNASMVDDGICGTWGSAWWLNQREGNGWVKVGRIIATPSRERRMENPS